jgi:hypothetical protein
MAIVDFAAISPAVATLIANQIQNQINRSVVLAQVLDVDPPDGKNITWDVKLGTSTAGVIADGVDVSVYNNDTKIPATLNYGTYNDSFSISGKAMAAAAASNNPTQLANLLLDEMNDAVERLAQAIGLDCYDGTGATDHMHGLHDSTVSPIGATGIYAGIDRATYTQWKGNVVNASNASLSFALLRQLSTACYVASGQRPDLFITDTVQHDYYGALFGQQRRYMDEIRRNDGTMIKLDGGYRVLEFDGVALLEDRQHPVQKVTAINTRAVRLRQLPDAPTALGMSAGTVALAGTPEDQKGNGKIKFTARVNQLARTGDAFKYQLICYPAIQVKRPNTCGYLYGLAA